MLPVSLSGLVSVTLTTIPSCGENRSEIRFTVDPAVAETPGNVSVPEGGGVTVTETVPTAAAAFEFPP